MSKRYKFKAPAANVHICLPTPAGTKNGRRLEDGEVFEVEPFDGLEDWLKFVNKRYPVEGDCISVAKGRPRKASPEA